MMQIMRRWRELRLRTLLTTGAAGIAILVGPAHGWQDSNPPAKDGQFTIPKADSERMTAEWQRFEAANGQNWRMHRDPKTHLPRMIYGGVTPQYSGTPQKAVETFVRDYQKLLGLDQPGMSTSLMEIRVVADGTRVTLRQQYRDLDVFDARIHVVVNSQGNVSHITNSTWPVRQLDTRPSLSKHDAQQIVEANLDEPVVEVAEKPRLVVHTTGSGRLAYLTTVLAGDLKLPWQFVIDAQTGNVLYMRQLVLGTNTGSGKSSKSKVDQNDSNPPRQSQPPRARQAQAAGPADPCDRMWSMTGPTGEVTITESGMPMDQYEVEIQAGISSFGIGEDGTQADSIYGAGLTLLPCIEYTIQFNFDLNTWDSYGSFDGFWDVFFVHANSDGFYWDLITGAPVADRACDTGFDTSGANLPGSLWTFGGVDWGDGSLCSTAGSFEFTYMETDPSKIVYLSVGLDTGLTGDVDGVFPSWGTYQVIVEGQTLVFDPTPMSTLNDGTLTDQGDSNAAVPCDGYDLVTLSNLNTPAAGNAWVLTGDYCDIEDIEAPAIDVPESRTSDFPAIRDCDDFEAVMCYYHITQCQLYIQALGFNNINNRSHRVDPHGLNGADNSHYVGMPVGAGFLAFGDGGVDDGEDGDIVLHEYGHSIQDNQTTGVYFGSGDNGFGNETRAMGEGFGDFWACAYFLTENLSHGFDVASMGEWDATNAAGLRRVDGTKTYPDDMANQVHSDGEIWSGSLWSLYNTIGFLNTEQLVLDSHPLVPMNPTFCDGAVAILAADVARNAGANEDDIVAEYVSRGVFQVVAVRSVPAGAAIGVDTADVRGDQNGAADFERTYCWGTDVELTAPAMNGTDNFVRWIVDNVPQALGVQTITVDMEEAHDACAVYVFAQADLNQDGIVSVLDMVALLGAWGPNPGHPADFDGDGTVGTSDLIFLLGSWGCT